MKKVSDFPTIFLFKNLFTTEFLFTLLDFCLECKSLYASVREDQEEETTTITKNSICKKSRNFVRKKKILKEKCLS